MCRVQRQQVFNTHQEFLALAYMQRVRSIWERKVQRRKKRQAPNHYNKFIIYSIVRFF